jgi:hypothetical protein
MTEAVYQFKAIARKLNRQEQKAEFEEKNPPIPDTSMYGWPYGVAVPFRSDDGDPELNDEIFKIRPDEVPDLSALRKLYQTVADSEALRCRGSGAVVKPTPLKSMAHPEWPYAGTPFEWSKFVKVKI